MRVVEVQAVHTVDDVAVEAGRFMGTQNGVLHGPMGDVPPTGRSVAVDYVQVLRFRAGKHVSFNLTFDRLMIWSNSALPDTCGSSVITS